MKTITFHFATALAEIAGYCLLWLWLKQNGSPWLLIPAGISLAAFAWLLTLHEAASGRVYAAYGGVYICAAIFCYGPSTASGRRVGMSQVLPWRCWV